MIARYGGGWRGIKPKVAGEHGAIGCIIYSDPEGDGYLEGDDYPPGGWRPREGVQRGSVMDTDYPGDPLTPGVGCHTRTSSAWPSRTPRQSRKFPSFRFPTLTRCLCFPRSKARSLPKIGAARSPSRITSAPAPPKCI